MEPNDIPKSSGARKRIIRESSSEYKTILGIYRSRTVWFRVALGCSKLYESDIDSHVVNHYTIINFRPAFVRKVLVWEVRRNFGQIARSLHVYPVDPRVHDEILAEWRELPRNSIGSDRALQSFQNRLNNGLNPSVLSEAGDNLLWVAASHGHASIVPILLQAGMSADNLQSPIIYTSYPSGDVISSSEHIARVIAASNGASYSKTKRFNKTTTVTLYWGSDDMGLGTIVNSKSNNRETLHTLFWLAQSDEASMAYECANHIAIGHWNIYHWPAQELMQLITFIFDNVVGHKWLEASECTMMGQLLLDWTTYACELEPATRSFAELAERQGISVRQAMTELSTSLRDQSYISHLPRRQFRLGANEMSFAWEYEPQESALELCREYEHLLLHYCCEWQGPTSHGHQTWPYSDKCSRLVRLPRSVKRARKRRQAKARRKAARAIHIPGSFQS